jgi:phospholipase C
MDNDLAFIELPTIWEHLAAAGLEGRYYFSDAPFAALFGPDHLRFSRTIDQFRADARSGRLPHVSFVDPGFAGELVGASNDYHPLSDIRLGDRFLHDVYETVTTSPAWEGTVLVVNFDEWGGFFDHVPPPAVAANPGEPADWGQLGFRVPCLVASPFARRGHVAHAQFDHCSVLRMIEWAFDLTPLTARTGAAGNLADVLDLSGSPDTRAPHWEIPWFSSTSCLQIELNDIWHDLISSVRPQGWPV